MDQDPSKNKELLQIRVEIAKPEYWKAYKEMRLLAIIGKDKEMFGAASDPGRVAEEKSRPDIDWQSDLSLGRRDQFVVLAWRGSEAIGMVRAKETLEKGVWYLSSGYSREGSRGRVFIPKAFRILLEEIQKRGGHKIKLGVKANNRTMIDLATILGFKPLDTDPIASGFYMELDLNAR